MNPLPSPDPVLLAEAARIDGMDTTVVSYRSPPPDRGRLTVVETIYHQAPGESPREVPSRYSRWLDSEESLYQRTMRVGEEWTPIDLGWLAGDVGMILLSAESGSKRNTIPTEEERREDESKVIEVSFRTEAPRADITLLPGESARFCPAFAKEILLRCANGKTKYTVSVIPS